MRSVELNERFRDLIRFILPPNGILPWTTKDVWDLLYYGLSKDMLIDIEKLRSYEFYRKLIKPIVPDLFGKVSSNTEAFYESYKKSPSVVMVLLHAILKTHHKRDLMLGGKSLLRVPDGYETMMIDTIVNAIKPLCYDNIFLIQNHTTAGLITSRFTQPYVININEDALIILNKKYRIDISSQEIINVYDIAMKILPYSIYDAIFVVLHIIYAFYEYAVFYNYGGHDLRHKFMDENKIF
jgi:hypothetical protein